MYTFVLIVVIILIIIVICILSISTDTFLNVRPKLRILIFSADDRNNDFVKLHNKKTQDYCTKYGHTYIFHDKNHKNVPIYWSKLLFCRDHLMTGKYDYVMWMDTDANIIDDNIDVGALLQKLSRNKEAHIFIGTDYLTTIYNAGVFVIKNSYVGRKFINQCINELKTECIDSNGEYTLGKEWAGKCYEQGKMNKLIKGEYSRHTVLIPYEFLKNTYTCLKDSFILHKFGPKEDIMSCFDNDFADIRPAKYSNT